MAGNLLFEVTISIAMFAVVKIPVSPPEPFGILRGFLFFGGAVVLSRLVDYVLGNAPLFLVGKSIGAEVLGLFSVAYDCAFFPQMALNATLSQVLLSMFSRIQTDREKTASGLLRLVRIGSIAVLPVLLVMSIIPHEFLQAISALRKNGA